MPTVAAGTTASVTLAASQLVTLTFDQGERAEFDVRRGGRLVSSGSATTTRTIGPFESGDVLTITASRGAVDYTTGSAPSVPGDGNSVSLLAAVIGDSRNAQNRQDLSAGGKDSMRFPTRGALNWLRFLTFQRVEIPWGYNLAVSGTGTAAIAARVADVLALPVRPRLCFINGGTNDFAAEATLSRVQAAVASISVAALELRAAGVIPVVELDHPRTLASWNANAAKCSSAYNRLMREWCAANGVRCADVETIAMQLSGANAGDPVAGYMLDIAGDSGIHRQATGALVSAIALQAAISDLLGGALARGGGGPTDAFDATYNPNGNLASNPMFAGTAGGNLGTGASGTVPDLWTNRVISGTMTCVSSVAARDDGRMGQWWVQTMSASAAATTRAYPTNNIVTTGKVAAGESVVAECDMEITALSGAVEYLRLYCQDYDGTAATGSTVIDLQNDQSTAGVNTLPVLPVVRNSGGNWFTSLRGRLRTPPMVIGQGITSAQALLRMEASLGAGASCTVKWGDVTLRKV